MTTSSSSSPSSPAVLRTPLAELGIGAAWLLGLSAANQILGIVFRSNPLAIVVLQAVMVDLAVGRAGVRWEPIAEEKEPSAIEVARRKLTTEGALAGTAMNDAARGILSGAGIALAVTVVGLAVSLALGWAKLSAVHAPNLSLVLGLMRAVAIGVRDVLIYVALPLHFAGRALRIPRAGVLGFAALAAGAVLVLQPAATPANVALAIAVSGLAAVLWARAGMGWAAAGLAGGWAFFAGTVFRGAVLDIDWKRGSLAPGFVADGAPAWLAVALFAAVAAAILVMDGRRRGAAGNAAVVAAGNEAARAGGNEAATGNEMAVNEMGDDDGAAEDEIADGDEAGNEGAAGSDEVDDEVAGNDESAGSVKAAEPGPR